MSYDISATVGLDGSGLSADINQMTGAVGRFARSLETQFVRMSRGEDGFAAYRASLLRMDDGQRRVIDSLLERNAAERQRQAAAKAAAEADKRRAAALEQNLSALKREHDAIGKTSAQLKIMELRSLGATQAQIKQARQTIALAEAHKRLHQSPSSPLGGVAGAAAAVGGTAGVIRMADAWTTLQNRLKLVHGTQAEVAAAQRGIIGISRETGQSLTEVGTVYQRFAANQKALNLNNRELIDVTDIVAKAMSNGGATAEGAAAALNQFGQAMASGVLRGEEFNSVMEQAPGLAQALAAGLGVSVGQLRNLANNGELTAQKVVGALQKVGAQVRADFAKTDLTIAQSFQILQNKATEFIGQTGESSGAVKVFSGSLLLLADHIGTVATVLGALGAVSLARWALAGAAGLVQTTAAIIATTGAAGGATAAQTALAASIGRTGTAAALASFEVKGFAGSLAVLRAGALATWGVLWRLPGAAVAAAFAGIGKAAGLAGAAVSGLAAKIGAAGVLGTFGAIGAAALGAGTALTSFWRLLRGEDASNWISRGFDGLLDTLGILDSKTETLGGKLYDWLHPLDELNDKLDEAAKKMQAVSGWQSLSKQVDAQGGYTQYAAAKLGEADLGKAISSTVLKYQEQAAAIGKSKEQMELLTLAAQKEAYLKQKRIEFEEKYKNEKPADRKTLVEASLAKTAAALDADIKSVSAAMEKAKTAAEEKAQADKAAAEAADKRREVESTLAGLSEQVAALGKTADEAARLKLAAQGATDAELNKVRAMQDVIRQYERQAGVMKTLEDLQREFERVGKTAAEIKLMDLRDAGATAAQLAQAEALLKGIAAREQAQQTIGAAGDKMLAASAGMQRAADKLGGGESDAGKWLAARRAQINADNDRRDAEIQAGIQRRNQAQGGFGNAWWRLFAERKYGHEHYQLTPEYKALLQKQGEQAQTSVQAAAALTQAGGTLAQAAGSLNQAAAQMAVPNTLPKLPAQTPAQQKGFEPADMGRITLDMRFPNGKALTGILFGDKDFLAKLKAQTKESVQELFLGVRDAVR